MPRARNSASVMDMSTDDIETTTMASPTASNAPAAMTNPVANGCPGTTVRLLGKLRKVKVRLPRWPGTLESMLMAVPYRPDCRLDIVGALICPSRCASRWETLASCARPSAANEAVRSIQPDSRSRQVPTPCCLDALPPLSHPRWMALAHLRCSNPVQARQPLPPARSTRFRGLQFRGAQSKQSDSTNFHATAWVNPMNFAKSQSRQYVQSSHE